MASVLLAMIFLLHLYSCLECNTSDDSQVTETYYAVVNNSDFSRIMGAQLGDDFMYLSIEVGEGSLVNTATFVVDLINGWSQAFSSNPCYDSLRLDAGQNFLYQLTFSDSDFNAVLCSMDVTNKQIPSFISCYKIEDQYTYGRYGALRIDLDTNLKYIGSKTSSSPGVMSLVSWFSTTSPGNTIECVTVSYTDFIQTLEIASQHSMIFLTKRGGVNSTEVYFTYLNTTSQTLLWGKKFSINDGTNIGVCPSKILLDSQAETFYLLMCLRNDDYALIMNFNTSTGDVIGNRYGVQGNWTEFSNAIFYGNKIYTSFLSEDLPVIMEMNTDTQAFNFYSVISDYVFQCMYLSSEADHIFMAGSFYDSITLANSAHYSHVLNTNLAYQPGVSGLMSFNVETLSPSTYAIEDSTGNAVSSISSKGVTSVNLSVSFGYTNTTYRVRYELESYSYDISVNTTLVTSILLSCSDDESVIEYSIVDTNNNDTPSWVSLDSATAQLTFNTNGINIGNYEFQIITVIEGIEYTQNVYASVTDVETDNQTDNQTGNQTDTEECEGYLTDEGECQAVFGDTSTLVVAVSSSMLALTGILSVITSLINLSSPCELWVAMHQVQLIVLLLISACYFPNKIIGYLDSLKTSSFLFRYINFRNTLLFKDFVEWLDHDVDYQKLKDFDVESGSALVNSFSVFSVMLVVVLTHATVWVICRCLKMKLRHKPKVLDKITKVESLFVLTIYIRLLLQTFMYWMLTSASELFQADLSTSSQLCSYAISVAIFTFSIIYFIAPCVKTFELRKEKDKEVIKKSKFVEYFTVFKQTNKARLFILTFFIRRYLMVLLFLISKDMDPYPQIGILLFIQTFNFALLLYSIPYIKISNNVIEVINEIFLFSLMLILIEYNKPDKWSATTTDVYIYLIMANCGTVLFVMIISTLFTVKSKLKDKCKKKSEEIDHTQPGNSNMRRVEETKLELNASEVHNKTKVTPKLNDKFLRRQGNYDHIVPSLKHRFESEHLRKFRRDADGDPFQDVRSGFS